MPTVNLPPSLRRAHAFLRCHLFYPPAFSTLLCGVLIVGRMVLTDSPQFRFLCWNLTLAWVPYFLAVWAIGAARAARGTPGRRLRIGVALSLWALFLPNAAYIMTDFVHLTWPHWDMPVQYDITMVFAFAWTGLLLWLISVDLVRGLVARWRGRVAGWAFVVASAVLTGAGVYLGRFLRWNSWDIATHPLKLLREVASDLTDPMGHTYAMSHTAVFATAVMLCYLTFQTLRWDAGKRAER
jgi:uncharacterized membrane protein